MRPTYAIYTEFAEYTSTDDWTRIEKEEHTDSWEQALGALAIYAADPDCIQCFIYDRNGYDVIRYINPKYRVL